MSPLTENITSRSAILPSIDKAWRKALRSGRFARCRRRVCELRASTRARSFTSEPSMGSAISGALEIIELKAREGWLGLHKNLLNARRIFA